MRHLSDEQRGVPASEWANLTGQTGRVVWITGLSGAGKSTVARALEKALFARGRHAFILDGDNIRRGLCQDLGFSNFDRAENVRRTAEVARIVADAGVITIVAIISPFAEGREQARQIVGPDRFAEVFVDCPLAICEARDSKGLYKKARQGELPNFTGVASDYVAPQAPDVHLHSDKMAPEAAAAYILESLFAANAGTRD